MSDRVFGSIAAFDPKSGQWELYETQFDFFILSNEVDDEKQKKALLLASIGMTALAYVRDLNMPTDLKDDAVHYRNWSSNSGTTMEKRQRPWLVAANSRTFVNRKIKAFKCLRLRCERP